MNSNVAKRNKTQSTKDYEEPKDPSLTIMLSKI